MTRARPVRWMVGLIASSFLLGTSMNYSFMLPFYAMKVMFLILVVSIHTWSPKFQLRIQLGALKERRFLERYRNEVEERCPIGV